MLRFSFLVVLVLAVSDAFAASPSANCVVQGVTIKIVPPDPTLTALDDDALIDRLQQESQYRVDHSERSWHIEQPAFGSEFAPIAAPGMFRGQDSDYQRRSPVMTELIRRGPSVLPALLAHLSDARETQLSCRGPDIGGVVFDDNYEPRNEAPDHHPPGVNTIDVEHGARWLHSNETYTYTVADLCFTAIGQIVNRQIGVTCGRAGKLVGHVGYINSPVLQPSLAEAARRDWAWLTSSEHETLLRADALSRGSEGHVGPRAWSGLIRLLFYYPAAGREVAERLLQRKLVEPALSADVGDVGLVYQTLIVDLLSPVSWPGLDTELQRLFTATLELPSTDAEHHFRRTELALHCAERLLRDGSAPAALEPFINEALHFNGIELQQPKHPLHYALNQQNDRLKTLRQKLVADAGP